MALSEAELADIRMEVGATSPPTDDDLEEIYDRRLSVKDTILEVLTKRLADYLANPAQFIVPGEYGQNVAANIDALEKQIERVRSGNFGLAAGAIGRAIPMVRYGYVR